MAELQERISSEEFTIWMAYSTIEPFGSPVENFRAGIIASTVANVAPRKKGSKALGPEDFYPIMRQPAKMSERQQKQFAALRAKRRQKGKGR